MTDDIVELLFVWFVQRLFKDYANPVSVFQFLKQACIMQDINPVPFQRIVLNIMSNVYNYTQLQRRVAYELSGNLDIYAIIKFTGLPKTHAYTIIKKQRDTHPIPVILFMTTEDKELCVDYLRKFIKLGGCFPC